MSTPEEDRRTAWRTDRDPRAYARRRAKGLRRRASLDRRDTDPTPPTDEDWSVADRSQQVRLPRGPQPLSSLLDDVVRDRGWDERLRGAMVFGRWAEVIGDELAQHCEPVRLAGGVLTVAASSPVWATQLRHLTGRLALNVNQALGEPVVTRVNVVVGRA